MLTKVKKNIIIIGQFWQRKGDNNEAKQFCKKDNANSSKK